MSKMKQLYQKYQDVIPYLFFGVCTTLVIMAAYAILTRFGHWAVVPASIASWIIAVLFAYVTNRKWVFRSQAAALPEVLGEMAKFFLARLATGGADWLCMFVCVDILGWYDLAVKFGANALVVLLNYLASRFFIFRK